MRFLYTSILFCFYSLIAASVTCQTTADSTPLLSNEIAFASDTQAPIWVETLLLKSNHNRSATKSIFKNIATRHPKALFILGDVVSLGYSNKQWKRIDNYLGQLRNNGVKVYAALGNHEMLGQKKKGQKKFQQRFPEHINTGYVEIVDSVAVILLNSNFRSLTADEESKQNEWYRNTLNTLDKDSSIQYIIAGCHHSPFTNSRIVSSSLGVRQRFVPAFLKCKKSVLFISGHSHNFEHFKNGGKDFLVIGGGGGLHQPLKQGEGILTDIDSTYKPMFHYLTVRRRANTLRVESIRLKADATDFEKGIELVISKPEDTVTTGSTTTSLN